MNIKSIFKKFFPNDEYTKIPNRIVCSANINDINDRIKHLEGLQETEADEDLKLRRGNHITELRESKDEMLIQFIHPEVIKEIDKRIKHVDMKCIPRPVFMLIQELKIHPEYYFMIMKTYLEFIKEDITDDYEENE